jgi:hypothetical protein
MSLDNPSTRPSNYRHPLQAVFSRVVPGRTSPLRPQLTHRAHKTRAIEKKAKEPRVLLGYLDRSLSASVIGLRQQSRSVRVNSDGVESKSHDFDIEVRTKTNRFESIAEVTSNCHPKAPYKGSLRLRTELRKVSPSVPGKRLAPSSSTAMLVRGAKPVYYRRDREWDGRTSGRLTRIPSLSDYPADCLKIRLQASVVPLTSQPCAGPSGLLLQSQLRSHSVFKSRSKNPQILQTPYRLVPIRPVLSRGKAGQT